MPNDPPHIIPLTPDRRFFNPQPNAPNPRLIPPGMSYTYIGHTPEDMYDDPVMRAENEDHRRWMDKEEELYGWSQKVNKEMQDTFDHDTHRQYQRLIDSIRDVESHAVPSSMQVADEVDRLRVGGIGDANAAAAIRRLLGK